LAERLRTVCSLFLLGLLAVSRTGADLYLRDVVITDRRRPMVEEVARSAEAIPSVDLGSEIDHPSLVPARWVQSVLTAAGFTKLSVVGSPVAILPSAVLGEDEIVLYRAVLSALRELGVSREAITRLPRLAYSAMPRGGDPGKLEVSSVSRVDGIVNGAVRFSFADGGGRGWIEAHAEIAPSQTRPTQTSSPSGTLVRAGSRVDAGDEVRLLFRRGTVEVHVAARAASSGSVGERVSAISLSNRRRFSGVVNARGEVVVELE
jgi:hypothetical protein